MRYHSAASLALLVGVFTWLWTALFLYRHAPAIHFAWPALAHGLAIGGLAYALWRAWLHVAWLGLLPQGLGNLTCFSLTLHNGLGPPWRVFGRLVGTATLTFTAAGRGALIRLKLHPPDPPPTPSP